MGKYTQSYRILSIEDIKKAYYKEMEENGYLVVYGLAGNVPFKRVNVLGIVVNSYIAPDERYGFLVIDDGSDEILAKMFRDLKVLKSFKKGDLVLVLGRISRYNEESQLIIDKIVNIEDMNRIVSRIKEIRKVKEIFNTIKGDITAMEGSEKDVIVAKLYEKYNLSMNEIAMLVYGEEDKELSKPPQDLQQKVELKEIKAEIMRVLKEKDEGEGVSYDEVISSLSYPENLVEDAIVELLTEGSCYEPKPGMIKVLE